MKITKNKCLLLLLAMAGQVCRAQTILPQTIESDMELSRENSPYIASQGVIIPEGMTLTIESGAEIRLGPNKRISVLGNLIAMGEANCPVNLTSLDTAQKWDYIGSSYGNIELHYTNITNATRFITANYGNRILLSHCKVNNTFGTTGDDCIAIHYTKNVAMDHIHLDGSSIAAKIDAIDADDIDSITIRNSIIENYGDDAIDIGTGTGKSIISHNTIKNCNFGISIGENSTAQIFRNVVTGCDGALQSHTGSNVIAFNNTFYKNGKGIECHHGSDPNSGGTAIVYNTIFSQSANREFSVHDNSVLEFSHSLSDKFELPGDSNLLADPLFRDAKNFDFRLEAISPCINKGSPQSPLDTNGNRTDMGAFEAYFPDTCCTQPGDTSQNPPKDTNNTQEPCDTNPVLSIKQKTKSQLSIFPNPASHTLNLVLAKGLENGCTISIYDVLGKLALETKTSQNNTQVDVSGLKPGVYIVRLKFGDADRAVRFVRR